MTFPNNYKDFSEQDFINDPAFQDWILYPDEDKSIFWNQFIAGYPEKKVTIEKAKLVLKTIVFKEVWPSDEKVKMSLQQALAKINSDERIDQNYGQPAKVKPMFRNWWAAAAILLLIAFGSFFLLNKKNEKEVVAENNETQNSVADISPGGNKAILTLADGSKIILDTTGNGAITKQGGVTVIKLDGQLAYNKSGNNSTEVLYNTITTPNGGQYQLVLADGTKVWLNAASSLRFPTVFAGKERVVGLTGEGYFEVAHNAEKTFQVNASGMEVKVLGTHFNINAYDNEETIKTTLLEGSVEVSKGNEVKKLVPGQQALLNSSGNIMLNHKVDIAEVIAWKNGMFHFSNANLKTVMRQLSRWYDVEVEYNGPVPQRVFEGEIQRSLMLHQVLKILEKNNVHFKIIGKKLLVMP